MLFLGRDGWSIGGLDGIFPHGGQPSQPMGAVAVQRRRSTKPRETRLMTAVAISALSRKRHCFGRMLWASASTGLVDNYAMIAGLIVIIGSCTVKREQGGDEVTSRKARKKKAPPSTSIVNEADMVVGLLDPKSQAGVFRGGWHRSWTTLVNCSFHPKSGATLMKLRRNPHPGAGYEQRRQSNVIGAACVGDVG